MKNRLFKLTLLAVVFAPLVAFAQEKTDNNAETYRLLNLFGDVFERVRSDYVEELTDEELIEAAIGGMLSSLDPHSSYLNSKNYRDMQVQTRGRFGGLGIEVTMESGLVKVVSPIDDTPAFRAGIEAGDLITHLDEEPVLGLTLQQAVEKMRGKVGTDIKLTVRREGVEDFDVSITRAIVKIRAVRSRMEGNVGYLRITSFSAQADAGVKKAIDKFREAVGDELQGVIFDLRNNPGGLLDQAVSVTDIFLDKGEIVSTRSRKPEDTSRYNARKGDMIDGLPLVVLINGGSASASEIVAGALQDHNRAILLGTKSFGKGSVQTIMPLSKQGAMRLTTARYFTPSGRSIQAVGIDPDIVVELAKIEEITRPKSRREADLRGALDNGNSEGEKPKDGEDTTPADTDKAVQSKPRDYQLDRALDLIRGVAMFTGMDAVSK
ncbi:MAG: S41 family peptidase [Rhodospirillaceae bacterium]|jgi:carboxyl-terminal processing protease|nr:S41 family peptidase [Rhodospirillaceae bacterium]MBT5243588.1 S41 family peptidase [Rhodospirillaceae bacterium]MBT5562176.1 S41 family peptidase [Rhodospirillaceae bacterium]MBT6242349.1 S41 family peptidase [Rhodospirillaceae bacterium]MBT7138945.1 S41 family peptidase [Rhodospirillaceae bacterium]